MIQDFISGLKPGAGEHTALRAQTDFSRTVSILGGSITTNSRSESGGVSARVYKNGVYGFASNAEYTPQSVAAVLQAAKENALFLDSRVQKGAPPLTVLPTGQKELRRELRDAEQKRYIDFVQALDAHIAAKYPDLASRYVRVSADSCERLLRVSDGCDLYSLVPRTHVYVTLTANAADGSVMELYDIFGGNGFFDELFAAPEALHERIDVLYTALMQKAQGIYPEAGNWDVILHPKLAGILAHEAVGHTVEADLVQSGSVAGYHLGKPVASELVTMVDYAHTLPDGSSAPIPILADDEGTPAQDAVLIENGILKGYMHSRESAAHFGVAPQGNARASQFSDEPLIRMRNTAILPGKSTLEEMIASIDKGYYFTDTNNGQADMTGEFMFGVCMGYEINKGKLGRALRDTTIAGVAFDMLKTVDMLSADMHWTCSGFCGKKQWIPVGMGGPAIKCKMNVGGR